MNVDENIDLNFGIHPGLRLHFIAITKGGNDGNEGAYHEFWSDAHISLDIVRWFHFLLTEMENFQNSASHLRGFSYSLHLALDTHRIPNQIIIILEILVSGTLFQRSIRFQWKFI